MVKLPPEVKDVLSKQKPIPVATASKTGVPNVCFVGRLKFVDDETLMIMDNYFNKTRANLKENPRVAVLCYDAEIKKSYQIKGKVQVVSSGKIHEEGQAWMHGINPKLPTKATVLIKVEEIFDSSSGPEAGKKIA
jgi:predicted pyridoxine 5'-phosphate oxidase superfamily flavin-nucleotide-binding protein